MPDFLPSREADLLAWSNAFSQRISADPGAYSLTQQQADDFAVLQQGYAAAFRTAFSPTTNSSSAVFAKRKAKQILKQEARRLARIIRAAPQVTFQQRHDLGLSVPDEIATPSSAPSTAPRILLGPCNGGILTVRLRDLTSPRRRRPRGVAGAIVFVHIGDDPPAGGAWGAVHVISRPNLSINLPSATAPGAKVWITACWLGTRLQRGPAAAPLSMHVAGGAILPPSAMRLAA